MANDGDHTQRAVQAESSLLVYAASFMKNDEALVMPITLESGEALGNSLNACWFQYNRPRICINSAIRTTPHSAM